MYFNTVIAQGSSGRFWWPLFDSNFCTVNVIFGQNQIYQKHFYIFWESDEQKKIAIIFDGFHNERNAFASVSDFFRAQLYLTKVSPRDLK